jgi:branched-chain amino acid transport system permease protein
MNSVSKVPVDKIKDNIMPNLVGRKRIISKPSIDGQRTFVRRRLPFSKKPIIKWYAVINPKNLIRERKIRDKRPLWWMLFLPPLIILPPMFGNNALLTAATIFGIYASINLMWNLIIGTAGIFSLATLAVVGAAAYVASYLSIQLGLPWPAMLLIGAFVGLIFGLILGFPSIRIENLYYALLTLGLVELCRVYVVQSRTLGSATGGLYGADSFIPSQYALQRPGLIIGFLASMALLGLMLGVYRIVNGQRLGLRLRTAREDEAAAEAMGIDFVKVRIQVFIISSAALGFIGGFYAAYFKGASPSLFSIQTLLLLFAMIVIGGMNTSEGAVVGTGIVVFIDKALVQFGPNRIILIGLVMLFVTLFTRGGLLGIKAQFKSFREKKKSQRRAARTEKGGEVMSEEATEIQDKQYIYYRRFDKKWREYLKTLVTDEIIEEHRRQPLGQHSDALQRLLNYFRRGPLPDKYAILEVKPLTEYKVVALTGVRGMPPRLVDDKLYKSLNEAYHAVFLRRVNDLLES